MLIIAKGSGMHLSGTSSNVIQHAQGLGLMPSTIFYGVWHPALQQQQKIIIVLTPILIFFCGVWATPSIATTPGRLGASDGMRELNLDLSRVVHMQGKLPTTLLSLRPPSIMFNNYLWLSKSALLFCGNRVRICAFIQKLLVLFVWGPPQECSGVTQ